MLRLEEMQGEHLKWVRRNFGFDRSTGDLLPEETLATHALLGVGEELGELNAAELKHRQHIRGMTDAAFLEASQDACADIMIFLMQYAEMRGFNLLETTREVLQTEVWSRDWIKYPETGKPGPQVPEGPMTFYEYMDSIAQKSDEDE